MATRTRGVNRRFVQVRLNAEQSIYLRWPTIVNCVPLPSRSINKAGFYSSPHQPAAVRFLIADGNNLQPPIHYLPKSKKADNNPLKISQFGRGKCLEIWVHLKLRGQSHYRGRGIRLSVVNTLHPAPRRLSCAARLA